MSPNVEKADEDGDVGRAKLKQPGGVTGTGVPKRAAVAGELMLGANDAAPHDAAPPTAITCSS
jgi:hypothetical protein